MIRKTLLWAIKTTCNLHCRYCYFRQEGRTDYKEKDLTEFEKMLEKVKPKVTYLSGGEPTLNQDLIEIINIIKERGIKTILATNGTLFTAGYTEKLIKTGIEGILVSLDGPDKKTHNYARSAFEQTMGGFSNLLSMRNPTQTRLGICYVVHKGNLKKLEETIKFAISKGLDYFMFQPVDIEDKTKHQDLRLDEDDFKEFLETIKSFNTTYSNKIILPSSEYQRALKNVFYSSFFGARCYAGEKLYFLDESFNLRNCPLEKIEVFPTKRRKPTKYCQNESLNCITMVELTRSRFIE